MEKFKATGRLDVPRSHNKSTPLGLLLSQISVGDLAQFKGIILGPALGYRLSARNPFSDGASLRRWLENHNGPGPGAHLPGFSRELTVNDLCEASKVAPKIEALKRHYRRLLRPDVITPESPEAPSP